MLSIEEAWHEHAIALDPVYGQWEVDGAFITDAARTLVLAVLDEAAEVEQYTCNVACDHGEECRTTRRAALRARIKALGG